MTIVVLKPSEVDPGTFGFDRPHLEPLLEFDLIYPTDLIFFRGSVTSLCKKLFKGRQTGRCPSVIVILTGGKFWIRHF